MQTDERRKLKQFLNSYTLMRKQLKRLDERRKELLLIFDNKVFSDIQNKISVQQEKTQTILLQIMEIIEVLPVNSIERVIMELRHIDCKSWVNISLAVNITQSPLFERYNKILDSLLENQQVRKILHFQAN